MKTLQLLHANSRRILLEFRADGWTIYDTWLRDVMSKKGVAIPAYLRASYDNQIFIRSDHPLFPRAFQELYYPLELDPHKYVWHTP